MHDVDVDAEREASAVRREQETYEQWLGHRAGILRREGTLTLEAARELWPKKDDAYLREIVERARTDIEKERQMVQNVWDGADMIERGAELFQEHPDASLRTVYELLEEEADGRSLGLARTTWINGGHGRRARELARMPEEEAERPPEPARAAAEAAEPEREPVAVTPAPANGAPSEVGAGDHILLEIGGSRFDARRRGDDWDVEFEGSVGAQGMREMMGRLLERVG